VNVHGNWRDPILINTIGHTAGVLLFGLIIILLIRDWRTHRMRQTRLSLIAAVLALGWNIGSLVALGSPKPDSQPIGIIVTVSFSMLSLLPAVLLQVAVHGQHRLIVAAGYVVSACAVALHLSELFSSNMGLHQAGLVSIAFGFGILTVTVFLLQSRRWRGMLAERSEWISLACLLLFTSSFLHFGYRHTSSPWAAEITWHHIGIPVALIVLLRDYRFLLLDTFIRFLVNSGLAAAYVTAVLVLSQRFRVWDDIHRSTFLAGIALVALCLSLILFAYLRNSLQAWVSRVIFRRQSADDCVKAIAKLALSAPSEEELLEQAAWQVAAHLRTDRFAIVTDLNGKETPAKPSALLREQSLDGFRRESFHAEAQIPLRFSSGDARHLLLGARRGGRRYWSDDHEDMRRLGAAIVEQVERFRAEELKRLVSQAELRALQAQINPHFLFNALNTLYGTIDRRSREARRMVLNLADIFRYFLQGHRTVIPLSEELRIVEAYLEIEALRLGDRLETELIVSESAHASLIPILSIQPLVENAIKHGVAAKQGHGRVSVKAENVPVGLRITVEDTGLGFERSRTQSQQGAGSGLENVRRRLALCYGPDSDLQIESSEAGTTVTFLIPNPHRVEKAGTEMSLEHDPLTTRSNPSVA
jgi:two-component system LytT family sensor kinase